MSEKERKPEAVEEETEAVEEDEDEEEEEWVCPRCLRVDDGFPMIGCDACEDWYHWRCVGILTKPKPSEIWLCPRCKKKKKTAIASKALEESRPSEEAGWDCCKCKKELGEESSIGCDECDKWFHFSCVSLQSAPKKDESWFCPHCIQRQSDIATKLSARRCS